MSDDNDDKPLPDNVVDLTTLTLTRKEKHCTCYDSFYRHKWPAYEVDSTNREVHCKHCGNKVDPFDALLTICHHDEKMLDETDRLLRQAKELRAYKPWLRAIKQIESNVRHGEMIPCCPHCHKGMLLDEINCYTNKKRELERRRFEKPKSE